MVFHFHNICLNSFNNYFLFSGRINISSAFLEFTSSFTILSKISFSIKLSLARCFLDYFLEAVSIASSPVSSHCFQYLLDRFLANDKGAMKM